MKLQCQGPCHWLSEPFLSECQTPSACRRAPPTHITIPLKLASPFDCDGCVQVMNEQLAAQNKRRNQEVEQRRIETYNRLSPERKAMYDQASAESARRNEEIKRRIKEANISVEANWIREMGETKNRRRQGNSYEINSPPISPMVTGSTIAKRSRRQTKMAVP